MRKKTNNKIKINIYSLFIDFFTKWFKPFHFINEKKIIECQLTNDNNNNWKSKEFHWKYKKNIGFISNMIENIYLRIHYLLKTCCQSKRIKWFSWFHKKMNSICSLLWTKKREKENSLNKKNETECFNSNSIACMCD